MQPGSPLAGSGAQAAAPSVSAPSVNIPRVDLTSSNKPCTQPGSITIPSSAPVATPALPFGTPQSVFGEQTITKDVAVNTSSPPGVTSPFQPAFGNPQTVLSAPSSGFGGPPSMKDAPLSTSSSPGGTSSFNLQLTIRNPQPVFGAPTFSFVGPQSMNTQPFLTTPTPAGASAFQPGMSPPQSASGGSPSKKNHTSFPLFAPAGTLAVQSANSTQPQAGFGSAPSAFGSPKNDPLLKAFGERCTSWHRGRPTSLWQPPKRLWQSGRLLNIQQLAIIPQQCRACLEPALRCLAMDCLFFKRRRFSDRCGCRFPAS